MSVPRWPDRALSARSSGTTGRASARSTSCAAPIIAVWPGESVALVAPSGAGKSTLLHIAGLLEKPDAGEVYIERQATADLADDERTAHAAR